MSLAVVPSPPSAVQVGWVTAMDIDFSAQPDQNINADAVWTIGGRQWSKESTANDNAVQTVGATGGGLVTTPKQNTNYYTGDRSAPLLLTDVAQHVPNFRFDTPIRAWVYLATHNIAAAADHCGVAFETRKNNATNLVHLARWQTTPSLICLQFMTNNQQGATIADAVNAANKVLVLELPQGIMSLKARAYSGVWSTGWPAVDLVPWALMNGALGTNLDARTLFDTVRDVNLVLHTGRAGSLTALVTKIGRVRLDYRP